MKDSKSKLQMKIGILLIIAQVFIIFMLIIFFILDWFTFDEILLSISIIFPAFSIHTTVIIRYSIKNKSSEIIGEIKNSIYILSSYIFPISLIILFIFIILLKVLGRISFIQYTTFLAIGESIFGIYIGNIIYSLFGRK